MLPLRLWSLAVGVGSEDEKPFSEVIRADFFRAEKTCLNLETHASKVSPNSVKS